MENNQKPKMTKEERHEIFMRNALKWKNKEFKVPGRKPISELPERQKIIYKNLNHEQFSDLLNSTYPIKTNKIQNLIERVHARYPHINIEEVGLITSTFFEVFRESILCGFMVKFKMLFKSYATISNTKKHGTKVFGKIIISPSVKRFVKNQQEDPK